MIKEIISRVRELNFNKVIVTGSQRSGTTISSKILAKELGYELIDENFFEIDNLFLFFKLLSEKEKFVIQSPALSHLCHKFPSDIFIVFMMRDFVDIEKSASRINWALDGYESGKFFIENEKSWEVKRRIWYKWQKPNLIDRCAELEYENMRSHPLWIEKESRVNFLPKQTSITIE